MRADAKAASGPVLTRSTYIGQRYVLLASANSRIQTSSCGPGAHADVTWFAGLSAFTDADDQLR